MPPRWLTGNLIAVLILCPLFLVTYVTIFRTDEKEIVYIIQPCKCDGKTADPSDTSIINGGSIHLTKQVLKVPLSSEREEYTNPPSAAGGAASQLSIPIITLASEDPSLWKDANELPKRQEEYVNKVKGLADMQKQALATLDPRALTADQRREQADALYFNGVPSFMREDWSVTRANDTVFPHALYGSNINNDPEGCCKFVVGVNNTDYSEIRPHIFSKSSWANWYKAIDLTKVPTKMKGPSRPQTFDGRKGYVDIAESKEGANGHGWDVEVAEGAPPNKVAESSKRVVTVQHSFDGSHGPPTVNPDPNEPRHSYFQEVVKMAAAFAIYDSNPRSESVIPAYCTACVGGADCIYIGHHIDRVFEFGVGYFVWFVNSNDEGARGLGRLLADAFPGRFILMTSNVRLGASGTWNRFIDFFFYRTVNPIPWFLNVNGDFFARENAMQDYLAFAQNKMRSNPSHTIIKFQHYSLYMYTYRAYMVLGAFDESVYPAYGEDVEMVYRARSMGLIFDDMNAQESQYQHIGSASLRDPVMGSMLQRWARDQYVKQKWNLNMYSTHWENVDFKHVHKHPWGQPSISHRNSYAIDQKHQECIRTGRGDKYPGDQSCFWHGEAILNLMPKGSTLSEDFTKLRKWNV